MKLSAKSRYAARLLIALAKLSQGRPVSTNVLARKTGISPQFTEQILRKFRISGITASSRGPRGGHILLSDPDDVTFRCIVNLMEGGLELAECQSSKQRCTNAPFCETRQVWREARIALEAALENITIGQFVNSLPYSPAPGSHRC